jgi:hypothetical protein
MNFGKIMMLALFLLPQAFPLHVSANQNTITPDRIPIAENRVSEAGNDDVNNSEVKRFLSGRVPPPKPKAPEVCSLENGESFFTSFLKDKNRRGGLDRSAYTASKVEIRNYDDPSKVLEVRDKENYDGFRIGFIEYMAFYLDPTVKNPRDYENVTFDLTRINPKTFRVDYSKAEYVDAERINTLIRTYGTKGAYIFEHRDGCWYLTQELRSDKPVTPKSLRISQFVRQSFSQSSLNQVYKSLRECGAQYGSTIFTPCAHRIYYFGGLVLSHDLFGTESSTITLIPYESAFSQQQALSYSKILAEKLNMDFQNPEFQAGKTVYRGCLYDLSGGALTPLCHIELSQSKTNESVTRIVLTIKSP